MAIGREDFSRTLSRITASLKSKDQEAVADRIAYGELYDVGIRIRDKINLIIERHEANIAYLQSNDFLSAMQRDLFNYAFYDYLTKLVQGILATTPGIKEVGRNALTNKLTTLVQEQTHLEDKQTDDQISSLEAKIAILPSIMGEEAPTSTRKMNLLCEMKAAANCTDNAKLIWVYRRLQQCDYDFVREPNNNCLFHFFRRHHTTQTWSTTLEMLKTRMMLNSLFALREGKVANFSGVMDNEFALSLLSMQRNRWRSSSGLTKANEWIDKVNASDGSERERYIDEAIGYYQNKFRRLWPEKIVPRPIRQALLPKKFLPFSGTGRVLS